MTERPTPYVSLGDFADRVSDAVARLERDDVVGRIWAYDHTVWRDDPTEISDRLGWLEIIGEMREHLEDLKTFANEVRDAFFKHVVLLGMGGSSLGPEVIRRTIGSTEGYPEIIVLDSTVPSWVRKVTREIDLRRTLFVVSSKSGSTIEPNSFYKHFRELMERQVGERHAGSHFVAITDPGTSLSKLADEATFRRTFENNPDIGGRYSVLSFFGLVPAALAGVDLDMLLDKASTMASSATATGDIQRNPAAWLGAYLGATAANGRDKLTLLASPKLESFGLWVEQLLAESTGKEGKGIIPVAGEPVLDVDAYGDDRAFVYLRLTDDSNAELDAASERLAGAGHPVIRLDLSSTYDIGAEFFRWEFATAVAGAFLGIHPFDQPNVQAAKDATDYVISQYMDTGKLPQAAPTGSLEELLAAANPGDYFAIMAYVNETPGLNTAFSQLRRTISERHRIATTLGYGPRFLHSTGQLHKGGPNTGLFLQLTEDGQELEIPGEQFDFRTLSSAQAMGDYQALADAGRRIARIDLGDDAEAGMLRLLGTIIEPPSDEDE